MEGGGFDGERRYIPSLSISFCGPGSIEPMRIINGLDVFEKKWGTIGEDGSPLLEVSARFEDLGSSERANQPHLKQGR